MFSFTKNISILVFLTLSLLATFSLSNDEIKIPILSKENAYPPSVSLSLGKSFSLENIPIDIGSKETWIFQVKEKPLDNNTDITIDYDLFSLKGVQKKDPDCSLFDENKKEIKFKPDFSFTQVKTVKPEGNFKDDFGVFGLGKVDSALYKLDSAIDTSSKNFGFSLNFKTNILSIGNLFDKEEDKKTLININRFSIVDGKKKEKWQILLKGFFLGNVDTANKDLKFEENKREDGSIEKIFIVPKNSKGSFIEQGMRLETIYNEIYVDEKFFDFLESNKYFNGKDDNTLCLKNTTIGEGDTKEIYYQCSKKIIDRLPDINLILENDVVLKISGENLVICDNEKICQFAFKYNSKVDGYVLGLNALKTLTSYFMVNEQKIYLDNEDKIFKVNLNETDYDILGAKVKKKIRKAFAELFRTIIVIFGLFFLLFAFFFIHEKFWGDKYMDKKEEDKDKEQELVEKN